MKQLDKITPRKVDFAKWYTDVVLNAKLASYAPVKGMIIFKPYGYAIWELLQHQLDIEFKRLKVENVYFPLLIPASLFNKEKEHIAGFSPEIATVTQVGDTKLAEPLYIRPTSEVLMAAYFKDEVKSYRDLPLIYNQWTNILRWEKTTRPFLRTSEFLWQEGHTLHATAQAAQAFTLEMLDVYFKFANEVLLLPVIKGRKTEKEKFAGADQTYTIESLMYDGQALQCGTSHFFNNNFTKVYDIKFQNQQAQWEHPYGTSWGVSTRLIGAIIMSHADDNGLVLPSKIAPIQIQIIPIKTTPAVASTIEQLYAQLSPHFRVNIDVTDKSFGFKMSEAEIKGIPLRIEVGPRDLENNLVIISRRDNKTKQAIKLDEIMRHVPQLLTAYDDNLYHQALTNRQKRTFTASTLQEYIEILNQNQGFVLVPFCGDISCETQVKQQTSTNSRCIPFEQSSSQQPCFNCQKPTTMQVYFARAY